MITGTVPLIPEEDLVVAKYGIEKMKEYISEEQA